MRRPLLGEGSSSDVPECTRHSSKRADVLSSAPGILRSRFPFTLATGSGALFVCALKCKEIAACPPIA
jgi:hypothetical protein